MVFNNEFKYLWRHYYNMFKWRSAKKNQEQLIEKENATKPLVEKENTTNYKQPDKPKVTEIWKDDINPYMPTLIYSNCSNFTDADHREQQIRMNPMLNKLTFKFVDKLLSGNPYPFSRAEPYASDNGDQNEPNIQKISGTTPEPIREKHNALPMPNMLGNSNTPEGGSMDLYSQQDKEKIQYNRRSDLDFLYKAWDKSNFMSVFKYAVSCAFGINCAFIVRTTKPVEKYWVFTRKHITHVYTKNRIPFAVTIQWPAINSIFTEVDNNSLKDIQSSSVTYLLPVDFNAKIPDNVQVDRSAVCVPLICNPTVDEPLGIPRIAPAWDNAIYDLRDRFYHHVYIHNGGVVERYDRVPDNITDATTYDKIEKSHQSGIVSPGITLKYPPGISPENIDKMYQTERVIGADINWQEAHDLHSQAFVVPKSFIDESVQNDGGMGGSFAAERDQNQENEALFTEFKTIEEWVKLCDKAFFKAPDSDYIIVPFINENANDTMSQSLPEMSNTDQPEPKDPQVEPEQKQRIEKSNSLKVKYNSITPEGLHLFRGDILLPNVAYPQRDDLPLDDPDQEFQYVDPDAIKEFVEDPKSVKEYYHYSGYHKKEILKEEATAKIKIIGVNPTNGGLMADIYFFQDPGVDEIELSPRYFCREERRSDGKTYQIDLDIRNNIDTNMSRSSGKTKARRL